MICLATSIMAEEHFNDDEEGPFGQSFEDLNQPGLLDIDVLTETIQPIVQKVSILLGGLFGIYFLLLLSRVYYEHQKVRLLRQIRYDLDSQNKHKGIPYSTMKRGIWKKFVGYLREKKSRSETKKK